jgi:hypothetical protein
MSIFVDSELEEEIRVGCHLDLRALLYHTWNKSRRDWTTTRTIWREESEVYLGLQVRLFQIGCGKNLDTEWICAKRRMGLTSNLKWQDRQTSQFFFNILYLSCP